MGFSVSASTAVIFAGLFLALGMFYPAMANSYERVQAADANQADRALEQANTDIRLDDASKGGGGSDPLEVTLTNTGSTSLTVSETDLLVDGTYIQRSELDTEVDTDSTTDLWLPGETLDITYNPSGSFSADRVRVVTEHGVTVSGDVT
jgi:Putative archaeal flagellar protein F